MLSGRFIGEAIRLGDEDEALDDARRNLNTTVFFGISDHWNTSVCLFHKELNGPGPRPSEYINARKGSKKAKLSALEVELLANGTQYDRILYNEALEHFKARAAKFDCPLVPSSV